MAVKRRKVVKKIEEPEVLEEEVLEEDEELEEEEVLEEDEELEEELDDNIKYEKSPKSKKVESKKASKAIGKKKVVKEVKEVIVSKEERERILEETIAEVLGDPEDFIKIGELGKIMKDILAVEGLSTSVTASTRVVSTFFSVLLEAMEENGKRFSLGTKQFRKGHSNPRVYEAKGGQFGDMDTLSLGYDTINISIPCNKKDNIKGKLNREDNTFTVQDTNEVINLDEL